MSNDERSNPNSKKQPPNTLLREEIMDINGNQIIISSEAYVKRNDGSMVRQEKLNHQVAADGRWLRIDEFVAVSWTGLAVPKDNLASCLNPFERHDYRLIYVNIDGFLSDPGSVLCAECYEYQKRRLFWKKLLLFGLIYNPKEY